MIRYQFFPRSTGLLDSIKPIVDCFLLIEDQIDSTKHNYKSDEVLAILRPYLINTGMQVEAGKKSAEKIQVPVLFGLDNRIDKYFYADGKSIDGRIILEVEAGRATENYQFLKDVFQASMMHGVEYLILAVRNTYRGHDDFEQVYVFLETLYISNRLILPLKGILLLGY